MKNNYVYVVEYLLRINSKPFRLLNRFKVKFNIRNVFYCCSYREFLSSFYSDIAGKDVSNVSIVRKSADELLSSTLCS